MVVSFYGPHFPYAVPAPYDTMYDPASVERWPNFDETFAGKPTIQQREQLRWNANHLG
ncbi:MAG: Choline-sulfatase [uncultured Chloroflexi bacterium]|uniref:Choline-sulfatase n=1 Tax=uncultured Chloroflexota bacterium TaxID=166587 RepID=A0A6J4HAI9_9CHLR|nr:MAG: Choline-sulfatase [uncultured Chloroflexota bacterium]